MLDLNPAADELSIIVPVYNEGRNFPALWKEIRSGIGCPFRVIVVYDFDEDDTLPVVQGLIANGEQRIHPVKNEVRQGVVGAILTGFNHVEAGPVLVVMGDLSDDLSRVGDMLDLYRKGNHIVVGSRYMSGGRLVGGPWLKQSLSRMAGLLLYWLRGIPTHDSTNAFKLYDSKMLKSLTIESRGGFELNLEITVKAFLLGYRIAEVPTTWNDRAHGQSRFRFWAWMPGYLRWFFYAFRFPRQAFPEQPGSETRLKASSLKEQG